ncbi:MAG: transposase [Victivallaceae bacterium]|nr:transposase [Victivallaceae bacterium]
MLDQCEIVHDSETPIRLLEPDKGKCKKAYIVVKITGLGPPLVSFHSANSRKKGVAEALYKNYYGTLIGDKYAGYADWKAECAGCRAHVRRKFIEANEAKYTTAEVF